MTRKRRLCLVLRWMRLLSTVWVISCRKTPYKGTTWRQVPLLLMTMWGDIPGSRFGFSFELWYQRFWIFWFLYHNVRYLILWHVTCHSSRIGTCIMYYFFFFPNPFVTCLQVSTYQRNVKNPSLLCVESREKNICFYVCDGVWQNEAKCCICMATANTFVWSLAWWPLAMCVSRLLGQKNTILPSVNPYN